MSKHMLKTFHNKNTGCNQHECNQDYCVLHLCQLPLLFFFWCKAFQNVFRHRFECFEYFLVLMENFPFYKLKLIFLNAFKDNFMRSIYFIWVSLVLIYISNSFLRFFGDLKIFFVVPCLVFIDLLLTDNKGRR